jgi:hypothetical protein
VHLLLIYRCSRYSAAHADGVARSGLFSQQGLFLGALPLQRPLAGGWGQRQRCESSAYGKKAFGRNGVTASGAFSHLRQHVYCANRTGHASATKNAPECLGMQMGTENHREESDPGNGRRADTTHSAAMQAGLRWLAGIQARKRQCQTPRQ